MFNFSLIIFLTIYSIFLAFLFGYVLIKGRKNSLLYSFLTFLFFLIIWNITNYEFYDEWQWPALLDELIYYGNFIFWTYISLVWYLFLEQFTKIKSRFSSIIKIMGFITGTILFLLELLVYYPIANPFLSFISTLCMIYSYFLILHSLLLLFKYIKGLNKKEKNLIIWIIPLGCLTILSDLLYNATYITNDTIILVTFFINKLLSLSVILLLTWELFQNSRFNNLIPLSYRKVLESMEAGIVIMDTNNNTIKVNHSFSKIFLEKKTTDFQLTLNKLKKIFSEKLKDSINKTEFLRSLEDRNITKGVFSLEVESFPPLHLKVKTGYLQKKDKKNFGRILTFTDITLYKKYNADLDKENKQLNDVNRELTAKNKELMELNNRITAFMEAQKKMAGERARRKISATVYSIVEGTYKEVINRLDQMLSTHQKESRESVLPLEETIRLVRTNFRQVNWNVQKFLASNRQFPSLMDAIDDLSHQFQYQPVNIEFTYDPGIPPLGSEKILLIHEICQEIFFHSLFHGKANKIDVIIKSIDTGNQFHTQAAGLKLYIYTNGTGWKEDIISLSRLRLIMEPLNRNMICRCDSGTGFYLICEIPLDFIKTSHNKKIDVSLG